MTGPYPYYADHHGRHAPDPAMLISDSPRVSLSKLALYLSVPSLVFEFHPASPWVGLKLEHPRRRWEKRPFVRDEFVDQFRHSVSRSMGDAAKVAVLYSGGLDSGAVLYHAASLCRRDDRELVAVVIDMEDDAGRRSGAVARRTIADLRLDCRVEVLDGEAMGAWTDVDNPPWTPAGPRIAGPPHLLRRINLVARELDVELLLTGDGADELLAAPRFMATSFLASGWRRRCLAYIRDAYADGGAKAIALEVMATVAQALPALVSTRLYWATLWPETCALAPPAALAEKYQTPVAEWSEAWLRGLVEWHAQHHRTWRDSDAWDACFPLDDDMRLFPNGDVPERSPFLDSGFLPYALSVELQARFNPSLQSRYHRWKALVLALYPEAVHNCLPKVKQLFGVGLARHLGSSSTSSLPLCTEYGLVDPRRAALEQDPVVSSRLRSIEAWLEGARHAGAAIGE